MRTAVLRGAPAQPHFELEFGWGDKMPSGQKVTDWVKELPGRTWDPEAKKWKVTCAGPRPDQVLESAGFEVDLGEWTVLDIEEFCTPAARISIKSPGRVIVLPRLAGYDRTVRLLGGTPSWIRDKGWFEVGLGDLVRAGRIVGLGDLSINYNEDTLEAIRAWKSEMEAVDNSKVKANANISRSTGVDLTHVESLELDDLIEAVGDVPDDFELGLFPYQRVGALAAATGRTFICDAPGVGKCLLPGTRVLVDDDYRNIDDLWIEWSRDHDVWEGDGGEWITLDDGPAVPTLNISTGKAERRKASHLYREHITAPVKTVKLSNGTVIRCTLPHRFWTPQGWAADLKAGDMVALAHNLGVDEKPESFLTHELVRLIAWQLGESYERKYDTVITNLNEERLAALVEDAKAVLSQLGLPGTPRIYRPKDRVPHVIFSSKEWVAWLREHGYPFGELSAGRIIPGFIMSAPLDLQAEFLAHFFAAEGWVEETGRLIEVDSASPRLMAQLQVMLSRQGVAMNTSVKMKSATNGANVKRPYSVGIISGDSVSTFRERIGVADEKKAARLAHYTSNVSRKGDRIPCLAVVEQMKKAGVSARAIHSSGSLSGESSASRKGVTREVAAQVSSLLRKIESGEALEAARQSADGRWKASTVAAYELFGSDVAGVLAARVEVMLSPQIRWAEVAEVVVEDYDGYVYDLTIPDHHNYVAEGVWTHNTRTSLAAAEVIGWQRLLLVVPPVVLTHWMRQARDAGMGSELPVQRGRAVVEVDPNESWILVKKPTVKDRQPPAHGILITADSLLASRSELVAQVASWHPEILIYDESHRAKTWDSARSKVMRDVAARIRGEGGRCMCLTGTPMPSGNHAELAAQMDITGHLDTVFGGYRAYMERFCRKNSFNQWESKAHTRDELGRILYDYVMIRRKKRDVLKDLPPCMVTPMVVDVDTRGFDEAHLKVMEKIDNWLDRYLDKNGHLPDDDTINEWANQRLDTISPMRVAAGIAKLPAAMEFISEWVSTNRSQSKYADKTWENPLLVWVHHHDVIDALVPLLKAKLKDGFAVLDGTTPGNVKDRAIDDFQDGKLGVLVCGITAISVGVTLTRGSDMLYIESDWVPSNMEQSLGRQDRLGQTNPVIGRIMVAPGTLDERLQHILKMKSQNVDATLGAEKDGPKFYVDMDHTGERGAASVGEIVASLVHECIEKRERRRA